MTETRPTTIKRIEEAYGDLQKWLQTPRTLRWDYPEQCSMSPVQGNVIVLGPETEFSEASHHGGYTTFYIKHPTERRLHVEVCSEVHFSTDPRGNPGLVNMGGGNYARSGYGRYLDEKLYKL